MDSILDTLLQSLRELVPYEWAQILLLESDSRLFVARNAHLPDTAKRCQSDARTIDATEYPLIQSVIASQSDILVEDTLKEHSTQVCPGSEYPHSWIGVPLIVSRRVLGLLSLGHSVSATFTSEHLRLAKLLVIPAAAAIQNARMYECAKIYGAELEKRTSDLRSVESALLRFHSDRPS